MGHIWLGSHLDLSLFREMPLGLMGSTRVQVLGYGVLKVFSFYFTIYLILKPRSKSVSNNGLLMGGVALGLTCVGFVSRLRFFNSN